MSTTPSQDHVYQSFTRWERGYDYVVAWAPYVTLLIGSTLALIAPRIGERRLTTLGLTVGAAAWVLLMFTLAGERRKSQTWMRFYFAGLILSAAVLMDHNGIFFVFVISGFIHGFLLRPWPLAFVGVAITSMVINSQIILPDPTEDELWLFGIIVVIQTVAIGFGGMGGEKISELSEQRRQTVVDLQSALDENVGLHAQLVAQAREAGVVDERQRMAREIHDTIAQGLAGVITQLEAAGQVKGDPGELARHLDNAARLARESLAEARRSVTAALPSPLVDRGLPEAITDVAARWSSLTRIPAEVTTTGTSRALHPEVEVTMLRVAQEALANIAKHAAASRVGVTLSYMGDIVTIDVRDDGVGFALGNRANGRQANTGFGLTAMRQRVEALSGKLEVESEVGIGTAVSASLPAVPTDTAID